MKHARADYQRIQDPAGIIPEDEPVFLLRAQDPAAPSALRAWADKNLMLGGSVELSDSARAHAVLMENWPAHKLADAPLDAIATP
jgi:hypothetical protein